MNYKYLCYDIEVYKNLIYILFYKDGVPFTSFEFSSRKFEIKEFIQFVKEYKNKDNVYFVGFNNSNYDYPIICSIIKYVLNHKKSIDKQGLLHYVYNISKSIVEKNKKYYYPEILNQIDLRLIHHLNNKNKKHVSLKLIEFNMGFKSIEELPYDPHKKLSLSEIQEVIDYCHNDVKGTYEFFKLSKSKIEFRHKMSKKYNINLINKNDVDIGGEILLNNLSKNLNKDKDTIRSWRTYRESISVNETILPYISFKSEEFNALLNWWKTKTLYSTKGQFTKIEKDYVKDILPYTDNKFDSKGRLETLNIVYAENKFVFGTGGLHATKGSEVWKEGDNYRISLLDVSSYYPNLAVKNGFHPLHLDKKVFIDTIVEMYNERMDAKKIGDYETVTSIKFALNGYLYGKSNSKFSWMFDSLFTMKICINGQLLLCKLAEECYLAGMEIIQCNTDGVLVRYHKSKRQQLENIAKEWMNLTKLKLDFDEFDLVVQRDVNNYFARYTDGKIKNKGAAFDYHYYDNGDWSKNFSMLVVKKAVENYFLTGELPEDFIKNHNNVYDFFKRTAVKKGTRVEKRIIKEVPRIGKTGNVLKSKDEIILHSSDTGQRINRYVVTNDGFCLYKVLPPLENKDKERNNKIEAGYTVQIYNKIESENIKDYDINYNYYINESYKIINSLNDQQ